MKVLLLLSLVVLCSCGSTAQWKKRTIYQILTDRFAKTDGSTNGCSNFGNYCGGTYVGATNHLDYIQNMGFDAIWISPIVKNTPGGYHGYWMEDLYSLNPNFGSESDFKKFVQAAHDRGMYIMVDVVANHMGPVGFDYSSLTPFNSQANYHNCFSYCSNCNIKNYACMKDEIFNCRTSGLPDLNTTDSYVSRTLFDWISDLVSTYSIDGLRVDTVLEIEPSFWADFQKSAGVYSVGETFNGNIDCLTPYANELPGLLSYPMYYSLKNAFMGGDSGQSLSQLNYTLGQYESKLPDPYALGTFIDNHDNPRWLSMNNDVVYYKSALTYVLFGVGIPIIYYGTEQEYKGGNDPNNREPLWTSKYNQNAELYNFFKTVVPFRKQHDIGSQSYVQRYLVDNFLCWTRGDVMIAVTNQKKSVHYEITYNPYSNGQKLCNLFFPSDCVVVANGSVPIYLNGGEVKIFYPV